MCSCNVSAVLHDSNEHNGARGFGLSPWCRCGLRTSEVFRINDNPVPIFFGTAYRFHIQWFLDPTLEDGTDRLSRNVGTELRLLRWVISQKNSREVHKMSTDHTEKKNTNLKFRLLWVALFHADEWLWRRWGGVSHLFCVRVGKLGLLMTLVLACS